MWQALINPFVETAKVMIWVFLLPICLLFQLFILFGHLKSESKEAYMTVDNAKDFRLANEMLSRRFDTEDYLHRSHWLIRFVENKRMALIRKMLVSCRGRFLDVGCGGGDLLKQIGMEQGVGIDLSLYNLNIAKRKPGLILLQADAENLPFKDNVFDAVICSEVLEHLLNPDIAVGEISRILKKNGCCVISVPLDKLVNFCKKIFKAMGFKINYGGAQERHRHIFTKGKLKMLLEGRGLRVVRSASSPFCFLPLRYVVYAISDLDYERQMNKKK